MNHSQLVNLIMASAKARGVLSHYCTRSTRCEGDRGLPDLILAGKFGHCFVEVKAFRDSLRPGQTTWKHMILAGGGRWYEIREPHLYDGTLRAILDLLETGTAVSSSPLPYGQEAQDA